MWFEGKRVGRLVRGNTLLSPALKPLLDDSFDLGARLRIERRLRAQLKDWLAQLLEPLTAAGEGAALRGLVYQLEQGLGCAPRRDVNALIAALQPQDLHWLRQQQVELGRHTVFARTMLSPERLTMRSALCAAFDGSAGADWDLQAGVWTLAEPGDRSRWLRLGCVALGKVAVRCDLLEQLSAQPEGLSEGERLARALDLLGCTELQARQVLQSVKPRRRRRKRRERKAGAASG